jgi:hypothetical protein
MTRRLFPLAACAVLLLLGGTRLLAADDTPAPVAEIRITTEGERLTVFAHLPIAALSDVNLPREPGGRLITEQLGPPLQLVARNLATSLEFEQQEAPLPMPTLHAVLTADGTAVDVELDYLVRAGLGNLSARLSPFRALPDLVPTVARFIVSPNVTRTFEIRGAPERVWFEPTAAQALGQFVGRGARALVDGWNVALFVLCLVVPIGGARTWRSSAAALLAGEAIAASMAAIGGLVIPPAVVPAMLAIAASAVVIAALQAMVNPASRWRLPLALLFGAANGLLIGNTFRETLSLAGSHAALSFGALIAVILLGQIWLLALLFSATLLLYRWGVPERVAVITMTIYVSHEALHLIGDAAVRLTQTTPIGYEHFLTALTLTWAVVVLAAGLLSTGRGAASGPRVLPDIASARS